MHVFARLFHKILGPINPAIKYFSNIADAHFCLGTVEKTKLY